MRTGATAALAAPLITVATSAPALAVSGPTTPSDTLVPRLLITNHGILRNRPRRRFRTHVQLTNIGTAPTKGPVVVTLTMPKGTKHFKRRPVPFGTNGIGWRGPTRGGDRVDGPWTWTFYYAGTIPVGGRTSVLEFVLHIHPRQRTRREGRTTLTFSAQTPGSKPIPSKTSALKPHRTVTKVKAD